MPYSQRLSHGDRIFFGVLAGDVSILVEHLEITEREGATNGSSIDCMGNFAGILQRLV